MPAEYAGPAGLQKIWAMLWIPCVRPRARGAASDERDPAMSHAKYRLVTRSDFDGLVCAVLLRELDMVDEITFVHPKDMQDRKVPITDRDITTNLPFVPGAYMVFDHHDSETIRNRGDKTNYIIDPKAPSAAR